MKAQRALLDSLMGGFRNEDLSNREVVKWTDSKAVCRYQLVSFCPYQVFEEARQEIGSSCDKDHGEYLRMAYEREASDKVKRRYEHRLLTFLRDIIYEVDCKIRRDKKRLGILDGEGAETKEEPKAERQVVGPQLVKLPDDNALVAFSDSQKARLADIERELQETNERMERLDASRNKILAQELVETLEGLSKEKNELINRAKEQADWVVPEDKSNLVCESCGALLYRRESSNKSERHLNGRIHLAYVRAREVIKELEEKEQARRDKERKEAEGTNGKTEEKDDERTKANEKRSPSRSPAKVEVIENKENEREVVVKEELEKYHRPSSKTSSHRKREFSPSEENRNDGYKRRRGLSRTRDNSPLPKQRSRRRAGSSEEHIRRRREDDRRRRVREMSRERMQERRRREEYNPRQANFNPRQKGYSRREDEIKRGQDDYRRRENGWREPEDTRRSRDYVRQGREEYHKRDRSKERRRQTSRSVEANQRREDSRKQSNQHKVQHEEPSRNSDDGNNRNAIGNRDYEHVSDDINEDVSEHSRQRKDTSPHDDRTTETKPQSLKQRRFSSSRSRDREESESELLDQNKKISSKDASDIVNQKPDKKVVERPAEVSAKKDDRLREHTETKGITNRKRSGDKGDDKDDCGEHRRSDRKGVETNENDREGPRPHSSEGSRRQRSRSRSRKDILKVQKKRSSSVRQRSRSRSRNRKEGRAGSVESKSVKNLAPRGRRKSRSPSRNRRRDDREQTENRKRDDREQTEYRKRDDREQTENRKEDYKGGKNFSEESSKRSHSSLKREDRLDSRAGVEKNSDRYAAEHERDERGERKGGRREDRKSDRKYSREATRRSVSKPRIRRDDYIDDVESKRYGNHREMDHSPKYYTRRSRSRTKVRGEDRRQYSDNKREDYKTPARYSPERRRRSRSRSRNRREDNRERFTSRGEDYNSYNRKSSTGWKRRSRSRSRYRTSSYPRPRENLSSRVSPSRSRGRRPERQRARTESLRTRDNQSTRYSRSMSRDRRQGRQSRYNNR